MRIRDVPILIAGAALLALAGCSMARGPGGEIIVGMPIGVLIETAEQGAIAAVSAIPFLGPILAPILISAVAGGATVKGTAMLALRAAEKRRKKADMAREAAEIELALMQEPPKEDDE